MSAGPALPRASGAMACTTFWGSLISALLVESEPPAMTTSASPRSMAAAANVTACKPVAHARVTVIASTDGGLGAVDAMGSPARYQGGELLGACDVRTRFTAAAEVFGPQKGASDAHIRLLTGRLERLVQVYEERYGVDVSTMDRAGAAGGLGGGLAARGAQLVDGVDLVAEEVRLDEHLAGADLVVTGEGRLDATSMAGKVVSGVAAYAAAAGVPLLVVVGSADPDVVVPGDVLSLVDLFGLDRAQTDTGACVTEAVAGWLARR